MSAASDGADRPVPVPMEMQGIRLTVGVAFGFAGTVLRGVLLVCCLSVIVAGAFLINETTLGFIRPDLNVVAQELHLEQSALSDAQDRLSQIKYDMESQRFTNPVIGEMISAVSAAASSSAGSMSDLRTPARLAASQIQAVPLSNPPVPSAAVAGAPLAPAPVVGAPMPARPEVAAAQIVAEFQRYSDDVARLTDTVHQQQSVVSGVRLDITNMFLMIRSFCLGALGGFAILIANYAFSEAETSIFGPGRYGRSLASMLMGGIVAILAFGLFYTKQISVFHVTDDPHAPLVPDFWRMTILCILAGAFAERIFRTAVNRMDGLIRAIEPGTGDVPHPQGRTGSHPP